MTTTEPVAAGARPLARLATAVPVLRWRPITSADIPVWHGLVQAVEAADRPSERCTPEDLGDQLLLGSWKDPARDSVIGLDADGIARAFAHVDVRPGDTRTVRAFSWGAVHPAWRRCGVGAAVLAWQEEVARLKVATRTAPARMVVQVDEHLAGTRALLARAGLTAARWYVEMTRPLAGGVPDVTDPVGVRVVPYEERYSEAVRAVHNRAFADHWGSEPRAREDWERATVGGRNFRADWSFLALAGDEVVGYTLASAYPQDWDAQGYSSGWTDLLGVLPRWRRRGVAPALLARSMGAMAAAGMDRADLGVDSENGSGAMGLYTRLGYRAAHRTVTYVKEL